MQSLDTFFAMGGYAAFVWPAVLLTLGVLAWLAWSSLASLRRTRKRLRALEALHPQRRRGRGSPT